MKHGYVYKIKPNKQQQALLANAFDATRFIYNWGLDRRIDEYKNNQRSINYYDLAKELTTLKKTLGYEWLSEVANESLQQSLRSLETAYNKFFKEHKGFPNFKSKRRSKPTAKFINSVHFDFDVWKVKLPKIGWIKLCRNRQIPPTAKIGTVTVSKDACGDYWISVCVETHDALPPKTKVARGNAVGIDLGLTHFAILSNGQKIDNPRFYKRLKHRMETLQRRFARSIKGSHRHERLRLKIARLYRRIHRCMSDFMHKLSLWLVRTYETIALETLNIKGLMRNHRLSRSIAAASWNEFVRQIKYKCESFGKNALFIGTFEPSSKTCGGCGTKYTGLTLEDRFWTCPNCGTFHDRDINAARNILSIALQGNNKIIRRHTG